MGEIRVGIKRGKVSCKLPNFTTITVLTKSSKYGELGPYVLKNEDGQIMENIWQFSKVYEKVPPVVQRYSQWDKTIIWEWGAETHLRNDELTKKYWNWRETGMNNEYAVRYPVGFKYRHNVLFSVLENGKRLDYVQARKKIYIPVYTDLVVNEPKFDELLKRHKKGENLLIEEIDGPHQESLDYYKENYDVSDSFIVNNTIKVTKRNMKIMLNDTKHPYGHGYCLAVALRNN